MDSILALGSNLGDSRAILGEALEALAAEERIDVLEVSPMVRTRPVGGPPGQDDFLNLVVRVHTSLSPFALLRRCQALEEQFHRVRAERWGPRTLDIDIVTYADLVMDEPELVLPHPRASTRAFVLEPWARMDPEATLGSVLVRALADRAPDADGILEYLDPPVALAADEAGSRA